MLVQKDLRILRRERKKRHAEQITPARGRNSVCDARFSPVRAEDPTDDTPKHHIEVDNETTHGAVFIGIVDPATDEGWQYDLTDFKHQDGVAPDSDSGI